MIKEKYIVKTKNYVGPIDLLYDLVIEKKLPISRISLSEVAFDFLSEMKRKENKPENIVYFIETASSLILIKSLSLLPLEKKDIKAKEEEDLQNLEKKLKVYALLKPYFNAIEKKIYDTPYYSQFNKQNKIPKEYLPSVTINRKEIKKSILKILLKVSKMNVLKRNSINDKIKLQSVVDYLRKKLVKLKSVDLNEEFKDKQKEEKVLIFLAVLDLINRYKIKATQKGFLGDIHLKKN